MDAKKLDDEHPATIGLVTEGGNIWGIPYKADVKSTIWYPIKAFEADGLHGSHDVGRADRPVRQDRRRRQANPWCVAHGGPGDATGWQITDWVEEVVLKTKGLDYYNEWISHEVTFSRPGDQGRLRQGRPDLLHRRTTSSAAARRSSHTDRRRRWTRCSIGDTRPRSAGCRRSRPGTARTSSRISGPAAQPSKYMIGEDIGIFPSRPSTRPRATPRVRLTRSWSSPTGPKSVPSPSSSPRRKASSAGSSRQRHLGQHHDPAEWYAGFYKLKVASEIVEQRGRDRLRRFGPHAGRRRRRDLLDAGSRLGQQRWRRHRCHPEGHRRQLARP